MKDNGTLGALVSGQHDETHWVVMGVCIQAQGETAGGLAVAAVEEAAVAVVMKLGPAGGVALGAC